jgi:hypothetical protein
MCSEPICDIKGFLRVKRVYFIFIACVQCDMPGSGKL